MQNPFTDIIGSCRNDTLIVGSAEAFDPSGSQIVDKQKHHQFLRHARNFAAAELAISEVYGEEANLGSYPTSVFEMDRGYPGDKTVVENYTHWLFNQLGIELPKVADQTPG